MYAKHGKVRGMMLAAALLLAGGIGLVDGGAAAQTDGSGGVTVDLAFGRDVDRAARELLDAGTDFPADGGKVYCLSRVQGLAAPDTVTHAWYHEGRTMTHVKLGVGSADWRTWSSKNYLPAWTGQWEVKVLDRSGKVLATAGFTVTESGAAQDAPGGQE
jgi:hypothetical protein